MTDFVQTMMDWRRMCKTYTVEGHECEGCPLVDIAEYACGAIFEAEFADVVDWAELERRLDKWAAEHPEPVYPTWIDWLYENGLVLKPSGWDMSLLGIPFELKCVTTEKAEQEIPADIAQKLGLKPKEG